MWAMNDVEILAEVLENGRSLVVMVRSNLYCGLKCTNLIFLIGSILLRVKQRQCSKVFCKPYVINCDALVKDEVPLANDVPRVEASSVLHAINNNQEYVTDSSGAKIGRRKVHWLQIMAKFGKSYSLLWLSIAILKTN